VNAQPKAECFFVENNMKDGVSIRFLLMPDGSSARHVRRILAERSACSGIVVGTWSELLEWACRAYLVPETTADNDSGFMKALEELEDAFWSESLSVAPAETGEAVKSALIQIVSATDPASDIEIAGLEGLPERPRRHLDDLFRLAKLLEGRWPQELSMMQSLLLADSDDALHTIRVYHSEGIPRLTRWQTKLVERLNKDVDNSEERRDEELPQILNEVLGSDSAGEPGSTLRFLQERLFEAVTDKGEVDGSVQWVGTRDFLQEAEVAAGMVQSMLADNTNLEPSDIGLLIPDSFEYATALEDACALGGIALSGLPAERWRRDLGREVVFHFLYCRQKPAPAMALAICLSSPLMPWPREEGAVLAQTVMDGDYRLRPLSSTSRDGRIMLDLLRDGDSEPASLAKALPEFVSLLRGGEDLVGHIQQAKAAVEQLKDFLESMASINWTGLRRTVSPRFITSGELPDFNLEGVTVWRESQDSWRPVKRLIVLGFVQGHYPSSLASDPVFSADDLGSIRELTGLPVSTSSEVLEGRRLRFKRQLGAVSESVTFLVPRRDPRGERQSPSESLVFMHQLFTGPDSADERIVELDAADDRLLVRHLALAAPASPQSPRALLAEDLNFDRDLLALRTDTKGQLKPESPSSLETLMVSRLAWLLRRLEAEPLLWAPESADVALLGTLAHKVFEGLFRPGEAPPDSSEIPGRVETLLDDAIRRLAPFLRASQRQVERRHFAAETIKAALAWRDVLARLGAEVLASEAWLQGTWSGIPIHGQTDLILGLPGDRLLVVDYKRSKSTSRRPRMEKGYDSQANLYRAMLESGGPKDDTDETLLSRIRSAARTGIVYYMLNDQVSLSDSALLESGTVPGWQTLENDVASRAMALIQRRLGEVSAAEARLNRDGDAEFFEKQAGIKPYALENSPLIDLFTVAGEAEEAQ
jgi:ATP-dependent helicase/nuclease subunit B